MDQICEDVNSLNGYALLLGLDKIRSLWAAANAIRESNPEKCLQYFTVLSMKAFVFPHDWHQMRLDILRDTITIMDQLKSRDYVIYLRFAEYCKAEGKYLGAGYHYKKAADAIGQDGIGFLTINPPPTTDSEEKHSYLREATACFQLGGDSQRASDCYIQAMQYTLNHSHGFSRFWLWLNWIIWGWGERPLRVVASGSTLIALYAVLYLIFGIKPQEPGLGTKFVNCLYFSSITFTTVGFGDLQPASI